MDLTPIAGLFQHSGEPDTTDAVLASHYQGILLGVAVGNLLGLPVEGESRQSIRLRFPQRLTEVDPAEKDRPWDDDLAQTVLLAEALLSSSGLRSKDLAERLVTWARENGRGLGILTSHVLQELSSGVPAAEAARRVWEAGGRQSAGNGAVMRCAPVALRWRRTPRRLVEDSFRSAQVTHYDPRCPWSVVAVNVALALSLEGWAVDLLALSAALDAAGAPAAVGNAARFVANCSLEDLRLDDPRAMGYTLKAMQAGLWALGQAGNLEETLIRVVNAGGDTDTNGAVAGALLGGKFGESAIPQRWTDCIPNRQRLDELALHLLAASHEYDASSRTER